jgi:hypothetical protein
MLKMNGLLMKMEQKSIKVLSMIFFSLLMLSCSNSKKYCNFNIYGSWIDIENKNELKSDLLPKGAKFEIDNNLQLKFYPIVKYFQRDIENIYVLRFVKSL